MVKQQNAPESFVMDLLFLTNQCTYYIELRFIHDNEQMHNLEAWFYTPLDLVPSPNECYWGTYICLDVVISSRFCHQIKLTWHWTYAHFRYRGLESLARLWISRATITLFRRLVWRSMAHTPFHRGILWHNI